MKQRLLLSLAMAAALAVLAARAEARSTSMVFWYPGEAGSSEQAQPIIDEFFKYISGKLGDITVHGRYYNTVEGGLGYIADRRPALGIVSFSALTQYRDKMGDPKVILATLPFPDGKPTERYALVGRGKDVKAGAIVMSSEPLETGFVRKHLFKDMPQNAVITPTDQLFSALKRISSGELDALAILTPTEAATLAKLTSVWTKGLTVIERSESVPTARVLLFDPSFADLKKLEEALLAAGKDPDAKDILLELRLKGFGRVRR